MTRSSHLNKLTYFISLIYILLFSSNLSIAAEGVLNLTGTANAVLSTPATLDIDANTALTMDSPNGSIDFPAGNITSNNRTLHTHVHPQTGGTGADGDSGVDTSAPKDGS